MHEIINIDGVKVISVNRFEGCSTVVDLYFRKRYRIVVSKEGKTIVASLKVRTGKYGTFTWRFVRHLPKKVEIIATAFA